MATLVVETDEVIVRLAVWEKILALHGNVRVPLSAVRAVRLVPDPVAEIKQYLSWGNTVSTRFVYGVRRVPGVGKAFVATRGHHPAILIMLESPSRFARVLATVPDLEATVATVRKAAAR